MDEKRRIPYGVINWAEFIRECHFVDDTDYLRKLEPDKPPSVCDQNVSASR